MKLAKCWLQFKNKFIVLFTIIFGTLLFPVSAAACVFLQGKGESRSLVHSIWTDLNRTSYSSRTAALKNTRVENWPSTNRPSFAAANKCEEWKWHSTRAANERFMCSWVDLFCSGQVSWVHVLWRKVKQNCTDLAVRSLTCHTAMGTHLPYSYLPSDRGDIPALTPAEKLVLD